MLEFKYFFFCGEELIVLMVKCLFINFLDVYIFNIYGLIEVVVVIISVEIIKEMVVMVKCLLIGYDKFNVIIFIWDDGKEVIELNVYGEIIIVGELVVFGYMNNLEKIVVNFFKFNGV